jgi:cytochrome c peroxidase
MKKYFVFISAASLMATAGWITSCKKTADPVYMLEPKQDVFAANYNYTGITNLASKTGIVSINSQKAAIGRLLFYDNRLSINGKVNCGTCHLQEKSFSDGKALSSGVFNEKTKRNSMAIINPDDPSSSIKSKLKFFWDGRAMDLNQLALAPAKNHVEMGLDNGANIEKSIRNVAYYQTSFANVGLAITEGNISACLSEFLRSMQGFSSRFDEGINQSGVSIATIPTTVFPNFTAQENTGKYLFYVSYNCVNCHGITSKMPQNTSSYNGDNRALMMNIGLDADGENTDETAKQFKAPSLRNIAVTAPYMHDGRFNSLEDVINHYSKGIKKNKNLASEFLNGVTPKQFNIPDADAAALVAFLNTLTDNSFLTDKRFSNPYLP